MNTLYLGEWVPKLGFTKSTVSTATSRRLVSNVTYLLESGRMGELNFHWRKLLERV